MTARLLMVASFLFGAGVIPALTAAFVLAGEAFTGGGSRHGQAAAAAFAVAVALAAVSAMCFAAFTEGGQR